MMIRTQSTEKQFTNSACVIKTKTQGCQNPSLKVFYTHSFSSIQEEYMFKRISKHLTKTAIIKSTQKNFCENI